MSTENLQQALEQLVPKSLDDIIRKHREQCSLALATDVELAELESDISECSVRDTLIDWQVVMIHITAENGVRTISPRLIGRLKWSGESWITSHVTGIDRVKGLVQTKNSCYQIVGERVDEAGLDLLNICVSLHKWGLGSYFGVPEFIY
jgi:hypothetical protein